MSDEIVHLWFALGGAGAGALVTGGATFMTAQWSNRQARKNAAESVQLELVRDMARYRMDQSMLPLRLNEIPVVFGDDEDIMDRYRKSLATAEARGAGLNDDIADLISALVQKVGLPGALKGGDMERGFVHSPNRRR